MDSAIDYENKKIIDAAELRFIENVDEKKFICRGCGCPVSPASYHPSNKVRPHFRVIDAHKEDCDVAGREKYIKIGAIKSIRNSKGELPISYPNKVVFNDYREVVGSQLSIDNQQMEASKSKYIKTGLYDKVQRKTYTVSTIRSVCKFFMEFPHDREAILNVPGIDAKCYQYAFKRIKAGKQEGKVRIFYAPIRWNTPPVENDKFYDLFLHVGIWDNIQGKYNPMCHVQVQWETWSQQKKSYVKDEVEYLRNEMRNKNVRAWCFFMGTQDFDDKFLFKVTDHRMICCLEGDIIYPKV
jgi:hypothetical protein